MVYVGTGKGFACDCEKFSDNQQEAGKRQEKKGKREKEESGGRRMIEIKDTDLPITVAEKIITGTRPRIDTPYTKAIVKAITGSETASESVDMFSINDIKEIADYLMAYYERHKEDEW